MSRFLSCFLLILVACWIGCSDPKGPKIQGTVLFEGRPLVSGELLLRPADGKGPVARAIVQDGKFETQCLSGRRRVEVMAYRETTKDDGVGGKLQEQYVPEQFNAQSKLEIEVKPSGNSPFTIDLK